MRRKTKAPSHGPKRLRRTHAKPTLILIGGHEDKEGDQVILREVARRIGRGKLVITSIASEEPDGLVEKYEALFRKLGVHEVENLAVSDRGQARHPETAAKIATASGVFFTGGDQLRITSQFCDTPAFSELQAMHRRGGVVAGTSAGASVVCETMLVAGESDASLRIDHSLKMSPGLGLVSGMIVDQHFAERGRLGRLLGAVAHNPAILGLGIDEDTAVVVEGDAFSVLGSGAVCVLDARESTGSNIADANEGETLSVHHVIVHSLASGERFDLRERRPLGLPKEK